MMNNFLKKGLFFLLLIIGSFTQAQIQNPVEWDYEVEVVSGDEYKLIIHAYIEQGWHLYSQELPEGGALPTVFDFDGSGKKYELLGKTKESETVTEYDNVFEMDLTYFSNTATFTQNIKVLDSSLARINATVEYQVCDDKACIFQTKDFEFIINEDAIESEVSEESVEPVEDSEEVNLNNPEEKRSFWGIFIVAFLSGFAALLTPCVFPMIPMTVSFFTKQSKSRAAGIKNAIFYGISIIVIYVFLGSLVTLIFGADSLNALSTNVWFNLLFFILLVIFAVSFMGAFEIVLPSSWGTKIDSKADKGGLIGIFFMALALAIVSFSCTGPIVGTLLVEAASKGGIAPIIGMLGFSLAIALPFGLFAAFPGWMNTLPKSGGWLNTVKVTLGFLELALAFKFLSNADLVLQLHILEREIFLAIWIAIFGMLALYLFGKIRLPHDSGTDHISVGRLITGLVALIFTIYLIPGLWGAPLKIISGFPPPLHYSESPDGIGGGNGGLFSNSQTLPEGAKYGPHDIITFHDYEKGMEFGRQKDLPVLLDFTGHACVNCRKMEERVWSEPQILNVLKNDLVLISLYVDDKRKLPESEQYVSPTTGKEIESIGNKWSDFQISRYQANAQPYYVLLDHEEQKLVAPSAYEPDADEYYKWLKKGIDNFNRSGKPAQNIFSAESDSVMIN
ncbi:protein-disulfide reductase DsbD family protein [Christiangramia sabulilitoris]|uniref:Thiol:disulfide interchange protein n=1 Tax=Christiangramia sabulilitoris TaxID=2583991 RepID=A0A550I831_9FLAO|nr:thioredoxin family protein [Christiangramia sabulilitoris]TRO67132.1 thiol:disulfide interchange protein [Christiangramia sabulilitoris]